MPPFFYYKLAWTPRKKALLPLHLSCVGRHSKTNSAAPPGDRSTAMAAVYDPRGCEEPRERGENERKWRCGQTKKPLCVERNPLRTGYASAHRPSSVQPSLSSVHMLNFLPPLAASLRRWPPPSAQPNAQPDPETDSRCCHCGRQPNVAREHLFPAFTTGNH